MTNQPTVSIAALLVLLATMGCGTTVNPRVGSGGTDRPGFPTNGVTGPLDQPNRGVTSDQRPTIDRVCRWQGIPSGWIAVNYATDHGICPPRGGRDGAYNVAVIERYIDRGVGTSMIVCADQSPPRGWTREGGPAVAADCAGARVKEGAPTVYIMRRVK